MTNEVEQLMHGNDWGGLSQLGLVVLSLAILIGIGMLIGLLMLRVRRALEPKKRCAKCGLDYPRSKVVLVRMDGDCLKDICEPCWQAWLYRSGGSYGCCSNKKGKDKP